jgi:hypothetical protein
LQYDNPNPDHDDARLSVEQIWRVGCSAGPLSDHDWKHFTSLARNRFYTFHLGCQHARETKQTDLGLGLEAGFVTELMGAPGLEKLWLKSEFRESPIGKSAYKVLRRRKFKARFRFV